MISALSRLPLALAGLLLLAACGMVARPGHELNKAVDDYAQRLRWQDYRGAATYLIEEQREEFVERYAALEDLRFVDVRIEAVNYRAGERKATSTLVVEYYQLPSLAVRKFRLHQQWAYQGGDRTHPGVWQVISPFPVFP